MTPEKQARLQACLKELATLLYEQIDKSKLSDLESIEKTVRTQMLEQVSPEIARSRYNGGNPRNALLLFLLNKQQEPKQVNSEE